MYNYKALETDRFEFITIAPVSELGNGERIFVEIDELPIVIFNIAGELFAIGDLCSHDNGPLGEGEIEGNQVVCPRHGARFDIRTGKALTLPAVVDIPAYPIRVVNGQIEVGIPA
jgi:3-phenylpropionate/trans-cinnamate dioxygenase ferredoxin component